MTYTEQDVERVAEAIYKADPCFYTYNAGDWEPSDFYSDDLEEHWREIARKQARAALEAMERETLEDVLEPDNVTDVHLMWCRTGDDEGEWRAFLNRDQIVSAERTWFGTGATIDKAIRNAVAATTCQSSSMKSRFHHGSEAAAFCGSCLGCPGPAGSGITS